MNAGYVDGYWMTWGKVPPISICGAIAPFPNVILATGKNVRLVAGAVFDKLALYALYIAIGQYVPEEAKKATGIIAYFCDDRGRVQIEEKANWIGWVFIHE